MIGTRTAVIVALSCLCLWFSPAPGTTQEQAFIEASGKPIVIGVSERHRRTAGLCLDYGKTRLCNGAPYRVVEPTRAITSHERMGFCKPAGKQVLSPVDGKVRFIERANATCGGVVRVTTQFSLRARPGLPHQRIFGNGAHLFARRTSYWAGCEGRAGGRPCSKVKPAQHRHHAHEHFAVRCCNDWPTCHLDSNFFWRDGPQRLSCSNSARPVPRGRMVPPTPC